MNRYRYLAVFVCLLVAFASTAFADLASYSPALPAPSPVPSYSLDDIPPSVINALAYDGTLHPARANFLMSYVEINPNDQRVWFNPQALETTAAICYNRRYRANSSSAWQWQYSVSPIVLAVTDNPGATPSNRPPSIVTSQVLYDPTNGFFSGTATYPFIMYTVWQPSSCNGVVGGFLHVSFSSDGTTWTAPRQVTRAGGPAFPCWSAHLDTVPVESAGAVYDGSGTIYLAGVEGDFSILVNQDEMDNPHTAIGWAARTSPAVISLFSPASVTAQNLIQNSYTYGTNAYPSRYYTYNYFFNMQMAYDAVHGDLYVSRAYPYGYDRVYQGGTPTSGDSVTPHFSIVYDRQLVNPENGMQNDRGRVHRLTGYAAQSHPDLQKAHRYAVELLVTCVGLLDARSRLRHGRRVSRRAESTKSVRHVVQPAGESVHAVERRERSHRGELRHGRRGATEVLRLHRLLSGR